MMAIDVSGDKAPILGKLKSDLPFRLARILSVSERKGSE
jgi:hypothetical protein